MRNAMVPSRMLSPHIQQPMEIVMKQCLSPPVLGVVLLVALLLSNPVRAQEHQFKAETGQPRIEMALGMHDGSVRAEAVSTTGYLVGGFASGFLLGLIGTGITYAIAASNDAPLLAHDRLLVADRSPEYVQGYQTAFTDRVRHRRKQAGLTGGLLGTATIVMLVLSSY
jgi:hypothetical protein